jgi:hypothetical protein
MKRQENLEGGGGIPKVGRQHSLRFAGGAQEMNYVKCETLLSSASAERHCLGLGAGTQRGNRTPRNVFTLPENKIPPLNYTSTNNSM